MTVQAAGYSNSSSVGNTNYNNDTYYNTPQDNLREKLQASNVWTFSGYFDGSTASSAYQG